MIGNNIYIGEGCNLEGALLLSNDFYTNDASRAVSRAKGEAVLGVGARPPGKCRVWLVVWAAT